MNHAPRRVVLVTRRTRLEELIARFHTVAQARFYVEHLGADFGDYEREHGNYLHAKAELSAALHGHPRVQQIDRAFVPNYLFNDDDLVLALGQDGLVANILKYLHGQPLAGINPDPARHDGVLLPFTAGDFARVLPELLADRRPSKAVTMARASLADGQTMLAVNDLFIGPRTHTSARYELSFAGRSEAQSSSGVIIATGLGSTGWMTSIVTGSLNIEAAWNHGPMHGQYRPFDWDAPVLRFAVREPFPSRGFGAQLVYGELDREHPLVLRSQMADHGVIFSDGVETDFLEFNAGATARIDIAPVQGRLLH